MTTTTADSLWLRRYHPGRQSQQLVCFPHAGGSASFYFPVSAQLAPLADVLSVQYPGRQDRRAETSPSDIATLSDQVYEALRGQLRAVPTTFFGHSMGAVIAFEVTRRLEADGGGLTHLFASGRRAPSRYRDENVHQVDDDSLVSELKLLSGTDAALLGDEEFLRMILPAIRSDYTAIETYRCEPGAVVRAPISALTGDRDPRTSLDEAEDWRKHTTGGFELKVYPGSHFYLTSQAPAILRLLREHLSAVG